MMSKQVTANDLLRDAKRVPAHSPVIIRRVVNGEVKEQEPCEAFKEPAGGPGRWRIVLMLPPFVSEKEDESKPEGEPESKPEKPAAPPTKAKAKAQAKGK